MPTPTTYTYSVENDFPDGEVNTSKLHAEIIASSIVTALDSVDTTGDVLTINFKDELSVEDKTTLDGDVTGPAGGLIAAHDNTPTPDAHHVTEFLGADGLPKPFPTDVDGNLKITSQGRVGSKFNSITHNFCDKCSWYTDSVKVEDEELVDSGDGLTFESDHEFWVDMKHGRLTFEDNIVYENGGKWISTVKVDNVTKVEDTDYTINYENGTITFIADQTGNTVTATYWYATTGTYYLKPPTGAKIELLRVEIQFSKDLVINDTIRFQAQGYAGVFAPQLVPTPYTPTTLIPLGLPLVYKCAMDYLNESNGVYPIVFPFGGEGWRGLQSETMILPWEYVTKTIIKSTAGMRIKISMDSSAVFGGEMAVVTFYCVSEPDV